jgi:hypothetical protein
VAPWRDQPKKLSKAVYIGLKGGTELPWEYWRAVFCERFGWTLDAYGDVTNVDVNGIIAVWDGIEKATPKPKHRGR